MTDWPTTEDVRNAWWRDQCPPNDIDLDDVYNAGFDRWLAAHDQEVAAKALEDARVRPEFVEYLPNDGEYEYTSTADCDGSNAKYLRRKPTYVGGRHPWEVTTGELFRKSRFGEGTYEDD